MTHILCDVEDCNLSLHIICFECDPIRLLCETHDTDLHVNCGISHNRKSFVDKCNYVSCINSIKHFCKSQHKNGYCDLHNKLVHPIGHKCTINSVEISETKNCDCDKSCKICNGSLKRTCYQCNGAGEVGHCWLCNHNNSKTGWWKCGGCDGKGIKKIKPIKSIHDMEALPFTCDDCKGTGWKNCYVCQSGQGYVFCCECKGAKQIPCKCVCWSCKENK